MERYTVVPPHVRAVAQEGVESPPGLKWSGQGPVPAIGTVVVAKINNIGPVKVTGYFSEHGWLGIEGLPQSPPAWYVKQNGARAIAHLFGAEIRP